MRNWFIRLVARGLQSIFGKPLPAELLADLKNSVIFDSRFPKKIWVPNREFARYSVAEVEEYRAVSTRGFALLKAAKEDALHISFDIGEISDAFLPEAIPVLVRIWEECPIMPIRQSVGSALLYLGTEDCLQALAKTIDFEDWFCDSYSVLAIFQLEHERAYDRLIEYFEEGRLLEPRGAVVAGRVLIELVPPDDGIDAESISIWLIRDPRWLQLVTDLLDHPLLGWSAREVFRKANADVLDQVDWQAMSIRTASQSEISPNEGKSWLNRYLDGERQSVWDELRSHELSDGKTMEEAGLVATETMKRVLHNVELLSARLESRGWKSLSGNLWSPPSAEHYEAVLERFRSSELGELPVSLVSFWRIVGQIDFVWDYRTQSTAPTLCGGVEVPFPQLDPLSVDGLSQHSEDILEMLHDWEEYNLGYRAELRHPFDLPLAPDFYHKFNCSGAEPYGVYLPCVGADPIFHHKDGQLPFVDYLRLAFRWGGFPLLESYKAVDSVQELVSELTEGFVEF